MRGTGDVGAGAKKRAVHLGARDLMPSKLLEQLRKLELLPNP
jgi:hypothetical protein